MTPRRTGFWRSVAFLWIPTFVALIMGGYFFLTDYPEMVREEKSRYIEELERFADEIESSDKVDFIWKKGVGVIKGDKAWEKILPANSTWKSLKPIEGTKRKTMWGKLDTPNGLLVWKRSTKDDDSLVYAALTTIEKSTRTKMILTVGIAVFLGLIFSTAIGVKFFMDYVRTRDDFMIATAHDLTTPLVAMRYMIGKNDLEASMLCERLLRLTANIKDFMRLGGRVKPKSEKVDLVKAYEEAYSLFKEDYRDIFNGCDIVLKRDEGVPAQGPIFVTGDETIIVQILWNLLGNDLKYAAPYGKIEVRIYSSGEFTGIAFEDEGQGMKPKEMRKAFDRYYRAKTVLVTGKGGFGIGLSTSKEFAQTMGGTLSVKSNKPNGCIFTLELPSWSDKKPTESTSIC